MWNRIFAFTPGDAYINLSAGGGEGVIQEVWDNGEWCRVLWDITGETGSYWIASMCVCAAAAAF